METWKKWLKEEDDFIIKNYKEMSVKNLSIHLNRTVKAVRGRIERTLNLSLKDLHRINYVVWSSKQLKYLKENYLIKTDKEIALYLFGDDKRNGVVFRKRVKLNLIKPKKGLVYNKNNNCEYISRYYNGKKIYEHIENAEKKLGRKIKKGEVVHHIDGNKRNNDMVNLLICKDKKEHRLLHAQLGRLAFELVRNGVIKYDNKSNKYI